MLHPIVEKAADLLTGYCLEVAPGDVVVLDVSTDALPLGRALVRSVAGAGGEPLLRLAYPEQAADLLERADDAFWAREPSLELAEMEAAACYVRVDAPSNAHHLAGADPSRVAAAGRRRAKVVERRLRGTRWVATLYPTPAAAQSAGMATDAFADFVFGAMFLSDADPAARWRELRDRQAELVARLERARRVRIVAEGTDLELSVAGRSWVNSDGRRNMPSGEVFTGPLEDSAEGEVTFDVPSAVDGTVVRGARLRFEGGRVVEARADAGEDTLLAKLDLDPGARRLGELGIGTNDRILRAIGHTLFDEKIAGTVHLALGRSYPETGGTNVSALHWDLIVDLRRGGRIELDGEPFQVDGRFV